MNALSGRHIVSAASCAGMPLYLVRESNLTRFLL